MRIAMVGLGKMGMNMTRRLLRAGHEVVAVDRAQAAVAEAAREGVKSFAGSFDMLIAAIDRRLKSASVA